MNIKIWSRVSRLKGKENNLSITISELFQHANQLLRGFDCRIVWEWIEKKISPTSSNNTLKKYMYIKYPEHNRHSHFPLHDSNNVLCQSASLLLAGCKISPRKYCHALGQNYRVKANKKCPLISQANYLPPSGEKFERKIFMVTQEAFAKPHIFRIQAANEKRQISS